MNEFQIQYQDARSYASQIKSTAEAMETTFNNMTEIMGRLTGEHWRSVGAEEVISMYNSEIAPRYPEFCQKLKDYSDTIIQDTINYEESDVKQSTTVTNA